MRAAVAVVIALVLAGCTLVDRRTFRGEMAAPGAAEIARAGAAGLPLVSVRMGTADEGWRETVVAAVQAAQQRAPGAGFDVMALVPLRAPAAEEGRLVARASRDARAVAEAMGAAGISPDQVRLGLLGDSGTPGRDVRVFQR